MMKSAELHRALDRALRNGPAGEEPDVKAAFLALGRLLTAYPDLAVDEFCRRARDGLAEKAKAKTPAKVSAAAPAQGGAVSESVVRRYLAELEQTRSESREFEKVVGRMKKDRDIRVNEAREIARRFTGSAQIPKTKADSVKTVLQWQISAIRTAGKLKRIADIF